MKSNMKGKKNGKKLKGLQRDLMKLMDNETLDLDRDMSYHTTLDGKEMKNLENKFDKMNQTFNWVNLGKEFENAQNPHKVQEIKLNKIFLEFC